MAYLGLGSRYGVAHRGGGLEHLENTPSAFAHALSLGFPVLETDVHASADGVLVVVHDSDLLRTTGRAAKVADLTWAEMSTISALTCLLDLPACRSGSASGASAAGGCARSGRRCHGWPLAWELLSWHGCWRPCGWVASSVSPTKR